MDEPLSSVGRAVDMCHLLFPWLLHPLFLAVSNYPPRHLLYPAASGLGRIPTAGAPGSL